MSLPRLSLFPVIAAAVLAAAGAHAGAGDRPAWLGDAFRDPLPGEVESVESLHGRDVVFFSGGDRAGFRANMVCEVFSDSGTRVGEILVVHLSARRGAAFILQRFSNQSLQPGQAVVIKARPAAPIIR